MRGKVLRAVAWSDLSVTLPFALPFIADAMIVLIYGIDRGLDLGTPALSFEMGPLAMMFVHIMGVLGVIWALARLRNPSPDLARIDAFARIAVAVLIIYAMMQGATPVLWLFVATEIAGSFMEFMALRKPPNEKMNA
ncbi:hypothetical protein [Parvibaculum sp.]|uniref:hypothetical protein n=1 Tax=Parvibaculum sp. TaxID=2024848 RepID=UPI001B0CD7C7|nr:hypothetical protein [Parvibaculum sp.]MBO6634362.1 hypothetical protein [Parvibaculum sp.]MBO6679864.1 hypothetical protein [Parvibaculum sp.]MBO6683775.1 hypothetical protein [Parvibaculum sp.]MBO6906289.1 hypothetical protein [Parvibaculum sp.]